MTTQTHMSTADRAALKQLVGNYYDTQKLRIQVGNRLVANFRGQLGQEPGQPTDDLDADAKRLIEQIKEEYELFASAITRVNIAAWRHMLDERGGIITSPYDISMIEQYVALDAVEQRQKHEIAALVEEFPIWETFLKPTRGCGPMMAAVIISQLDPHKATHPSSFWMYAGLDVGPDGLGRSRRKEHLVRRSYKARDGEEKERDSITYEPWLKTKLMGVLGPSFVKLGGPYRAVYDGYKRRLEAHPYYGIAAEAERGKEAHQYTTPKVHRHMMAVRYTVKMFLLDLWREWRALEGLDVGQSYQEAKLGYTHHQSA